MKNNQNFRVWDDVKIIIISIRAFYVRPAGKVNVRVTNWIRYRYANIVKIA